MKNRNDLEAMYIEMNNNWKYVIVLQHKSHHFIAVPPRQVSFFKVLI